MALSSKAWVPTRYVRLHVLDALVHLDRAILAQPSGADRNLLTEINLQLLSIKESLDQLREQT